MDEAVKKFKERREIRKQEREDTFNEMSHKRDKNGRFVSTGGSNGRGNVGGHGAPSNKVIPASQLGKPKQITNKAERIYPRKRTDEFSENDHPRDENGKFTSGGGSGSKALKVSGFKHMGKEERGKALDDAPDGANIRGVYVKNGRNKGVAVSIRKRKGLSGESAWYVNGKKDPNFKSTIRKILDGTSEEYGLH